jgi:putative transposase
MQSSMVAQLVSDAMLMAIWRRRPSADLLHRSDRGSQYSSEQFQQLLAEHGVLCSTSRSGNCWDNAAMESFFSTLKTERTNRKVYRTRDEARADVFDSRSPRTIASAVSTRRVPFETSRSNPSAVKTPQLVGNRVEATRRIEPICVAPMPRSSGTQGTMMQLRDSRPPHRCVASYFTPPPRPAGSRFKALATPAP